MAVSRPPRRCTQYRVTGLAAYDTQKLRALARVGGGSATMPVNGALALYLDFVNLFVALLRLLGNRRE
jgi:FtsH-binding integral membrane protein